MLGFGLILVLLIILMFVWYRKMQRELRFLEQKKAHKTRLRDWEKKVLQHKKNTRRYWKNDG